MFSGEFIFKKSHDYPVATAIFYFKTYFEIVKKLSSLKTFFNLRALKQNFEICILKFPFYRRTPHNFIIKTHQWLRKIQGSLWGRKIGDKYFVAHSKTGVRAKF